jgi:predicted MPP superfamily phosphohydrolase
MRKIGVGCTGIIGCVICLVLIYGSFIEPNIITITRLNVPLAMHSPVKIALVSDFHVGPYKGAWFVRRVAKRINREMPDLILIVGDLVLTETVTPETLKALEPLGDLHPAIGTYAVMGNHDHSIYRTFREKQKRPPDNSTLLREKLESLNITVLENDQATVNVGADALILAGIEDALSGQADIVQTLLSPGKKAPIILMSHNPDIIRDPLSKLAAIIVTGHTHGGQLRLPWYGPLAALPTRIGRYYDQGMFTVGSGTTLFITRGIGESGPRARLFAPPEIMLITTTSE